MIVAVIQETVPDSDELTVLQITIASGNHIGTEPHETGYGISAALIQITVGVVQTILIHEAVRCFMGQNGNKVLRGITAAGKDICRNHYFCRIHR